MTAVLPPIKGAIASPKTGNNGGMQTEVQYLPGPPKGSPENGLQMGKLRPLRKMLSKNERKMFEKLQSLRTQLPVLTKRDTTKYRNTYKHNLCLDMLQEGYHMSFRELFALIQQQEEDRIRAGPDSIMWTQVMLHEEYEKLDMLKTHLTNAEAAERKYDYSQVYAERSILAKYFLSTKDKWLSDHFFNTCLTTSQAIEGDGGQAQAEGHRNVGISLKESGDYFQASKHFEAYHELASDNTHWVNEEGVTFYTDACINLYNIYTNIGNQLEDSDPDSSLQLLLKAYQMASNSGDHKLRGESTYTLGLAYDKAGDEEKALLHLEDFLSTCKSANDYEGIGRACDAIAKTYSRAGKVSECIKYLKQFVETAEKSGQEVEFSKACHNLGNIYNSLGKYEEATEYFSKAYNVSRAMGEASLIHANRVQYGIAMAHRMLKGFGNHIIQGHQPCLERLIEWKSARTDEFEKPIPNPSTPTDVRKSVTKPEKKDTKAIEEGEEKTVEQLNATTTQQAPSSTVVSESEEEEN
ncbi:tetratricopeptide repeat protein 29-like [Gigantopelta aegis]|uniref:tetratricopeptide repeat protein 29-like n=1 Tax=Gigantopelta aegis TaxID=1735272 RepID=UPI001B88BF7A|nr:tetratricopeptide repeat protein 29-like [Gigantopelta aegis]